MRDDFCPECRRLTGGDCGRHDPTVVIQAYPSTPARSDRDTLLLDAEQALNDFSGGVDEQYWSTPLRLIRALLARCEALAKTDAEREYGLNGVVNALHGEASDFELSFPVVRGVDDMRVERDAIQQRLAEARDEVSAVNRLHAAVQAAIDKAVKKLRPMADASPFDGGYHCIFCKTNSLLRHDDDCPWLLTTVAVDDLATLLTAPGADMERRAQDGLCE